MPGVLPNLKNQMGAGHGRAQGTVPRVILGLRFLNELFVGAAQPNFHHLRKRSIYKSASTKSTNDLKLPNVYCTNCNHLILGYRRTTDSEMPDYIYITSFLYTLHVPYFHHLLKHGPQATAKSKATAALSHKHSR